MTVVKTADQLGAPSLPTKKPIWRRIVDPKIAVLVVVFLVTWQIASSIVAGYSVPTIPDVVSHLFITVTTPEGLVNLFTSLLRVGLGLATSFIVGLLMGLLTGAS